MKVTNVSARLHIFHQDILPGECVEIPKQYEKALRASAVFGVELVEGDLSPKPPAPPKEVIKGLQDMSESNAIAKIATETDLSALESWGQAEERQDVLKAIAARYAQLGGK